MMPEVRDLSDALPDLPMDPITGVGVVASRNRAPTGYDVVSSGLSSPTHHAVCWRLLCRETSLCQPPVMLCVRGALGMGVCALPLCSGPGLWEHFEQHFPPTRVGGCRRVTPSTPLVGGPTLAGSWEVGTSARVLW